MFFDRQELQHKSTPGRPDAVYARKLQEVLGCQYGEITVAMQYGFQSGNMHLPAKYRDLLYGIGAEEFGHVEMLATMIAQLLEDEPVGESERAVDLLSFLLARDTMHRNQSLAAAAELQEEGVEQFPVPNKFPQVQEATDASYEYINFSDGERAGDGRWASGPTPDGHAALSYRDEPARGAEMPAPTQPDPRLYGTTTPTED